MTTANMAVHEIMKRYGVDRPEVVDAICGELIKQLKYTELATLSTYKKELREEINEKFPNLVMIVVYTDHTEYRDVKDKVLALIDDKEEK